MEEKYLLAVCDTLRKECSCDYYLKGSLFLGEFDTEPKFDFFSFGLFPGLKENGNISIRMEVYEINDETLSKIDSIKGVINAKNPTNYYDRIKIQTPYGTAYTYITNLNTSGKPRIHNGDWKIYKEELKIQLEKK